MTDIPLNLTFDDILLVPQYSETLPKETEVKSKITKKLKLKIPLMSAAMDTVTEHKMAITMALEGGRKRNLYKPHIRSYFHRATLPPAATV